MPKFMFAYHDAQKPIPQDEETVMAAWFKWMTENEAKFADQGNPVGMSKTVRGDTVEDNGGSNPLSGYGIVNAANIEEACEIAKGCPIHASGGSVEVAEIINIEM